MADDIGYGEALAELETILGEIEEERVDIDELAVKVKRAAELIRLCRARIKTATLAVDTIVDDMEAGDDE
jgi:exodeoxyribonuclease VII small subunit